jgi:hypothetical protein
MKRGLIAVSLVLASSAAFAQPPAAGQTLTVVTSIQRAYATMKTNLNQAASEMPESEYSSKPSTMPEMRAFGQLLAHVAQSQFGTCAVAKKVPNPMMGRQLETELKTKAEFVKALADSFTFCDDAYSGLTDANSNDMLMQGRGQITRAALLMNNIVHDNEMAGTTYVYMRAKGHVPPSTENAPMRGGAGAPARGAGGGRGR